MVQRLRIYYVFLYAIFCLFEAVLSCPPECGVCTSNKVECSGATWVNLPQDLPPNIQILKVENTRISELDDRSLPRYTQLRHLYLQNNEIATISKDAFDQVQYLKELDLTGNRLTEVPNALQKLKKLQSLHIGSNRISNALSEAWSKLVHLEMLDLHNNTIESLEPFIFGETPLRILNLKHNRIATIENDTFSGYKLLRHLKLSSNRISIVEPGSFEDLQQLEVLDMDGNEMAELRNETFSGLSQLSSLNLRNNEIQSIEIAAFRPLVNLLTLDISRNNLTDVHNDWFLSNNLLHTLNISNMDVTRIHHDAFAGLDSLSSLDLSGNKKLSFIHRDTFNPHTPAIETINMSRCNMADFHYQAFQHLANLSHLAVLGNPLMCKCAVIWFKNNSIIADFEKLTCTNPATHTGIPLSDLNEIDLNCTVPKIIKFSKSAFHKVGTSIKLECVATGDPIPAIIWITSLGKVFRHNDYHTNSGISDITHDHVDNTSFHDDHHWHTHDEYIKDIPKKQRVHLLQDGSLYIDYVQRTDAGDYTCIAMNPGGNDTVIINVRLNYSVIRQTQIMAIIIGAGTSFSFLILTLSLAGLCRLCIKCREQARKKRKGIRQILENLDAYKTEKIDTLQENFNKQMGKIKDQCSTQMLKMRNNYHTQVARIKDNCSQQMEKLRENYATQVCRMKDFKTHKIENLRENYASQKAKIREYGAVQLKKLHESYKLQQQHLMKILETMNLDNCKGVIESECTRTESMLFNTDDFLPSNTPPTTPDTTSESEYMTASETSSVNEENAKKDESIPDEVSSLLANSESGNSTGTVRDMGTKTPTNELEHADADNDIVCVTIDIEHTSDDPEEISRETAV